MSQTVINMDNLNFGNIDMHNIIFDIFNLNENSVKFFIIIGRSLGGTNDIDSLITAGEHFDEIKKSVNDYKTKNKKIEK